MGQINCQCQYNTDTDNVVITQINQVSQVNQEDQIQNFQPKELFTKLVLKNENNYFDIILKDHKKLTFGTTPQSFVKYSSLKNEFKIQINYKNKMVYLRDCGIGLGAFLKKSKIKLKADSSEHLINIQNTFVMIQIKHNYGINCIVYQNKKEQKLEFNKRESYEINIKDNRLILKRQRSQDEFLMRMENKQSMWIFLSLDRKIRPHDIIRLGSQLFQVESISSYLQSSAIVKKY